VDFGTVDVLDELAERAHEVQIRSVGGSGVGVEVHA
jgi:hypothetical protein